MTIERLKTVHQARPFQPFVLHMADGKRLRVSHPESLAYTPTGRTVILAGPDETHHYIDLLLVARIEIPNGVARRRTRQ